MQLLPFEGGEHHRSYPSDERNTVPLRRVVGEEHPPSNMMHCTGRDFQRSGSHMVVRQERRNLLRKGRRAGGQDLDEFLDRGR